MSEGQEEPQVEQPDEQPTPEQPPSEDGDEDEAHEDEEVEGQEGEPEAEPEASAAAGAVGEKELEKMLKRVETANMTYRKRIAEIMGEEVSVLESCPRCADPVYGAIWPPMMKPVSAEVKALVLASVGEQGDDVTANDPYSRQCDTCQGAGHVLTGSRVTRQRTIKCLTCEGRGWVPVGAERTIPAHREQVIPPSPEVAAADNGHDEAPQIAPDQDLWGRDKNHPDYGVHPMYVGAR